MRRRARASAHLGNILDAAGDAAKALGSDIGDSASDVVDAISDAGKEIGAVLKFVAPIVAFWPGIGTALAVALEAAGAYASGDKIEDAVIEVASAAMPPGVPRAAFDGVARVVQTYAHGGNIKQAMIDAMRSTAQQAGGDKAVAAFDAGLALARGQRMSEVAYRAARQTAQQGGTMELAAFDGAVAIANGGDGWDAATAVGRDFATQMGGPLAGAGYEFGVALATGKSLQDAGFAGFKGLVAGNTLGEKTAAFLERLANAKGRDIGGMLKDELVGDAVEWAGPLTQATGTTPQELLAGPVNAVLDGWFPSFEDWPPWRLAEAFGVPEMAARAAQGIMSSGEKDVPLHARLTKTAVQQAIEKYGAAVVASKTTNESYTQTKADIRADQLTLVARMPSSVLSYATAKAEQAAPLTARAEIAPPPSPTPVSNAAPLDAVAAPVSAPRSRHSVVSDVALGGVVAAAAVALFWWAKS